MCCYRPLLCPDDKANKDSVPGMSPWVFVNRFKLYVSGLPAELPEMFRAAELWPLFIELRCPKAAKQWNSLCAMSLSMQNLLVSKSLLLLQLLVRVETGYHICLWAVSTRLCHLWLVWSMFRLSLWLCGCARQELLHLFLSDLSRQLPDLWI